MFHGKKSLPPGPTFLSHLLSPPASRLNYLKNLTYQYGDLVTIPGIPKTFLINHIDTIAEILQNRPHGFSKKNWGYQRLAKFLGQGLLVSDNEVWKKRRRLLQPVFHRQALIESAPLIVDTTEAMIEQWQSSYIDKNKTFNLTAEMLKLVLTISANMIFSLDVAEKIPKIIQWVTTGHRAVTKGLLIQRFVPTLNNLKFYRALDELEKFAYLLIQKRRKNPGERRDMLTRLLEAKDAETGEGLSEQAMIDEIKTFLVTGHETSGYALGWTWWHLTQHPDVLAKVKAEVDAVLGNRRATFEDAAHLSYTRMVIEESMRLYPPIWVFTRKTLGPLIVQDYTIPAKSNLIICPYTLHRHPLYWPDSEKFNPDRFLTEETAKRPKLAYLPFGAGARVCIAGTFAMLKMPLILATMLQKITIQNKTRKHLTPYPQFSLKQQKPFRVSAKNN